MSTWRKVGCCLIAAVCGVTAAFGAAPLPAGYKLAEYVELRDGSIDTGITVNQNMELRFKFAQMAMTGYKGIIKDHIDENTQSTRIICNNGSKTDFLVHFMNRSGGGGMTMKAVTAPGEIVEGYLKKGSAKLNNATATLGFGNGNANSNTLGLYGYSDCYGRIYSFQIWDNSGAEPALLRDYVPCVNVNDPTDCGLWDGTTVRKDTATIVAGPIVSRLAVAPLPSMDGSHGFGLVPESVTVTDNQTGATLTRGRDYDYTVSNNDGVGMAVVTVRGLGSYVGEMATATFEITASSYEDDNIRLDDPFVRVRKLGNRTIYIFTNTTAEAIGVTVKRDITIEKLLVVGGGGAGGNHFGGGGGGGGVVYEQYSPRILTSADTVSVLVGTGGVGKADENWRGKGGATTLTISGTAITAFGGGGGANYDSANPSTGSDIGSAGGGDNQGAGKTYTASQGNAGGARGGTAGGGGGGGAAEPGENGGKRDETHPSYTRGGNGGEGLKINITGEDVVYGSGGGGGGRPTYSARNGKGGTNAGDGVWSSDGLMGLPALAGFGGGGGGGSTGGGGTGGSGTVILQVAVGDQRQYQFAVLPIPDQLYFGTPLRPEPVVSNTFNGAILVKDRDYTLEYEGGSLAPGVLTGRGVVFVRGKADTGYAGKVETMAFGITRAYQFEMAPIADMLHYLEPVTPEPVLTNAVLGVVPVKGEDYRVEYENNNAAGTATVRAVGIGSYAGIVREQNFALIRAYRFEMAPVHAQFYGGEPVTPEPAVTNPVLGVLLTKGTDFTYSYVGNDTSGTAKVIATGLVGSPYFGWAATNTFEVLPTYSDDPNFIVSDPDFGVKTLGKRKVYVFTNATLNLLRPKRTVTVEKLLVVGGGGSGGGHIAGGGGGGGFVYSEEAFLIPAGQDFGVAVGAGGIAVAGAVGKQGGSSYLQFGDERLSEAYGGGGGGAEMSQPPQSVTDGHIGSAGGAAHSFTYVDGQHYNSTQGNRGGLSSGGRVTTGGGGAGGHGVDYGQEGGPGKVCGITGVEEVYGSGGGAGAGWGGYGLKTSGKGGVHAGDGAVCESYSGGTPGDPGFGGGGGGAAKSAAGGNGGSGTVILYIAERDTLNYRYTVLPPPAQAWTGEEVRPEPVVSNIVSGAILRKGVDYTLSWTDCDRPGTGRVTALGVDGSDYDGASEFATFPVLDGTVFTVMPIGTQYYFGEAVEPTLTVTNLVLGYALDPSDYTVEFLDNEGVGEATAVVTGAAGTMYAGKTVEAKFQIVRGYFDENVRIDDISVRCLTNGDRLVYVFTNAMTSKIAFLRTMTLVDMLVVGGGGAGGGSLAGGGGGGGLVTNNTMRILFDGDESWVTVGAGGRGNASSGDAQGNPGGESSLTIGGFSIVAYGGGGGGTCNRTTKDGVSIPEGVPSSDARGRIGSGGGSTKGFNNSADGLYYNSTQGHRGASGPSYQGGGGGGAFAPGSGPVGGEGVTNAITGTEQVYASGGGGGGGYSGTKNGPGGTNAGMGALSAKTGGGKGKDGFGAGGGGGGWDSDRFGGSGGSGTVILAFVKGGEAGQPELDEKDVDFGYLGDYTIPRVSFALGGKPDAVYSATVTVSFGVGEETEPRQTGVFAAKTLGDAVSLIGNFSPATGSEVWCRIVIEAVGAVTRTVSLSKSATGKVAPFIGHGGGASVMHVWADAPGNGSGSDWLNAMTDVRKALEGLSAQKPNIWICGVVTAATACVKTTLTAPAAIRGGFTGAEDDPLERPRGARSVLDGADQQNILLVAGNYLLTLDSIEFTHAKNRAVERTGGALLVTNCNFEANGTTVERLAARALYASGSASVTADFVDTRFAKNTEKGTYAEEGCCVLLSSFKRATFDNCTFMTNGIIPNVVSGTTGYGEGNVFKGAALKVDGVPLTMRNCRFFANRAACRGANGGTVRLFNGSYPSAFTNCLFVGNSERQPHPGASEAVETGGGAIVLDLGSASGLVEVDTCTFAWNAADCRQSSAGINVRKGAVRVRNSIFWKNWRRDVGTAGTDIDVKADGSADVDYSLFAATNETCITTADAAKLTLGGHIVCGDPKFFTRDDDLAGIVKTNKSTYNFIYLDWNRLNELVRFNAHLRGGRHVDETTGAEVFAAGRSPAINAGDPAHGWSNEPAPNGRRVNMGFYGNTPWATMSPGGTLLLVR